MPSEVYAGSTSVSFEVFGRHRGRARALDSCGPRATLRVLRRHLINPRNEGVPGSSPGVGFPNQAAFRPLNVPQQGLCQACVKLTATTAWIAPRRSPVRVRLAPPHDQAVCAVTERARTALGKCFGKFS